MAMSVRQRAFERLKRKLNAVIAVYALRGRGGCISLTSQRREVSPSPNGGASLNLPKRAVDKSSSGGCEHGSHRRTVAGYEKADAEREAVVCSPVARRNTGAEAWTRF